MVRFPLILSLTCSLPLVLNGLSNSSCIEGRGNVNDYEDDAEEEACSCQEYYPEQNPFLWGDDEDPSQEGVIDATWPGKREDGFFDSLTR